MEINIDITDKFKVLQKGGISAMQEAVLMVAPWEVGKEKYFSDKVDSLISEWKEKRL